MSLFLFVLVSLIALAEEPCTDGSLNTFTDLAKTVSVPNCLNLQNIRLAQKDKLKPLCETCRKDFEIKYGQKFTSDTISEKKNLVFDLAFQEYKKTLSNSLVEIAKLRALHPTKSQFNESIKACEFKSAEKFKDCSPEMKQKLKGSLESLQGSMASELAQILSPVELKDRSTGILERDGVSNICFIPEKDILYLKNKVLEEAFTPELLEKILSTDLNGVEKLDDVFIALEAKHGLALTEFRSALGTHPLLSIYNESPKDFVEMIRNLNPRDTKGLMTKIYSKEMGDKFDQQVAQNCQNAFSTLSQTICSPSFAKGDLKINPFNRLSHIDGDYSSEELEFANDDKVVNKNLKAFQFCSIAESEGSLDVSSGVSKISEHIGNGAQHIPFNIFKAQKYEYNVGVLNINLCDIKSGKSKCDPGSFICDIYQRMEKSKNPDSVDARMAKSSNEEINQLLRSFIGNPQDLSPEVKKTLVAQGILPQEDGKYVPQPQIPERSSDFNYSSFADTQPAQQTAPADLGRMPRTTARSSASDSYYPSTFRPEEKGAKDSLKEINDMLETSNDEIRNVQDEILRRLSSMPSSKKPVTMDQAKKLTREAFKAVGKTPTKLQEHNYATKILDHSLLPTEKSSGSDSGKSALASSETESAMEKYKKDGMNRALADMYGARVNSTGGSVRGPASAGHESTVDEKQLTTVALNIKDDSKQNLMQVFSDKLNANDPETQLLKVLVENQTDFLLQIKDVNFKIQFTQNSSVQFLFESGNKDEADKLRPLLEIFIKRIQKASAGPQPKKDFLQSSESLSTRL